MTSFDYSGVMWAEATRDYEAEATQELQLRGKLATASFWPFLAAAESETDFGHRLVLIEDRIAAVVAPPVLSSVLASVATDWKLLHESRQETRTQAAYVAAMQRDAAADRANRLEPVRAGQQFFDVQSGKWVTVGSAAPVSKDSVCEHSGTRVHQEGRDGRCVFCKRPLTEQTKQAYIDPSDAQRYSHYPNMNPPVDNGPLQGPDGFVTGGEGDAGRSDAVIQQRQLTPGQWTVTPGTEWPVRPNAADPTQVPRTAAKQVIGGRRQAVSRETLEDIERRDPDAGERQPTQADYDAHRAWAVGKHGPEAWERYRQGGWDLPDSHASRSQVPRTAAGFGANGHPTPLQAVVKGHFIRHGDGWHEVVHILDDDDDSTTLTLANGAKVRSSSGEQVQMMSPREHQIHHGSRRQAGEGIVPTPGPNPNYFSQGSEGIAGPPSFPENPSSAIEPKTDNRMNDLYGAVPPQASSGSAQGLVDGQGYSRQVPGSSATAGRRPFFDSPVHWGGETSQSRSALPNSVVGSGGRGLPDQSSIEGRQVRQAGDSRAEANGSQSGLGGGQRHSAGRHGRPSPLSPTAMRQAAASAPEGSFSAQGGSRQAGRSLQESLDALRPGSPLSAGTAASLPHLRQDRPATPQLAGAQQTSRVAQVGTALADRTAGGFDDGHVERYLTWAQGQGHDPDEVSTLKKYQKEPGVGRAHVNHIADQLYIGGGDSDWRKQAGTNGRIVGHCDHCSQPVRYHTGENGVDELRHLHNNHNDCSNGQKAASLRRSTAFFDPKDASVRVLADGMSRTRPTLDNPSGAGDEYDANTWNNAVTQRPMQSAEDRGINTPTQPREPIGTVSSEPGRDDDDDRNQNGMARETSLAGRSIEDLMGV